MTTDRAALAARIHRASHLTGTFTLRSGAVSHEYFDKYLFESDPRLLASIGDALAELVPADVDGRRLLIVEDVVTSGGQAIASIGDLRDRGAIVEHAICVIDRQAGGARALAEIGVRLRPLYTMAELTAASVD